MIKKVLGRSFGGTAIAGLVLTAAPVAVSPQIALVACPGYPAAIKTSTTVTLQRNIAQYGARTVATIRVTSGSGTPQGSVRLVVNSRSRGVTTLVNGRTTRVLPRRLPARKTHTITAQFLGNCAYDASQGTKLYSVFRAKTTTRLRIVKPQAAKFRARVVGSTGLVVRKGKVRFVVRKANGTKVRTSIKRVRRGVARTDMRDLKVGRYKVSARYVGSGNYQASKRVKRFRVR